MARRTFNPPELMIAGAVAIGCATGAVIGLVGLAKPVGFEQRLASVDANLSRAAQDLGGGAQVLFPPDAVCPSGGGTLDAEKLRARLSSAVSVPGLQSTQVAVVPQDVTASGFAPLRVRIEATGDYSAAIAAIGRLSAARPILLIDTVDLVSKTSVVTLSVSGRAFCSAQL